MTVTHEVETRLLSLRLQSHEYTLSDVRGTLAEVRDLVMVMTFSEREVRVLRSAANQDAKGAGGYNFSLTKSTSGKGQRTTTGRSRIGRNLTTLRQKRADEMRVVRISMESPLELLIGVPAVSGTLYLAVDRILKIRERFHKSNTLVMDLRAQKSAREVDHELNQLLVDDLKEHGLSSDLLRAVDMKTVIGNAAAAIERVDQLSIE